MLVCWLQLFHSLALTALTAVFDDMFLNHAQNKVRTFQVVYYDMRSVMTRLVRAVYDDRVVPHVFGHAMPPPSCLNVALVVTKKETPYPNDDESGMRQPRASQDFGTTRCQTRADSSMIAPRMADEPGPLMSGGIHLYACGPLPMIAFRVC